MILTILALSIGLGLVIALWALSRDTSPASGLFEDPSSRLLPPAGVVSALFDPRDRDFALRQNSPELVAMLETRRRSAALLWLASVRREALAVTASYRAVARTTDSIKIGGELRILWQLVEFVTLHALLTILVRNVSVFRIEGLVRQLHGLSEPLLGYGPRLQALDARAG